MDNHHVSESETEERSSSFRPGSSALNRSKHYFSDSDNDIDGSRASPTSSKMSASPSQLEPISSESKDSEDSPIHNTKVGEREPTSRFTFEHESGGSFDKADETELIGTLPGDQRKQIVADGADLGENSTLSPRTIAIQHAQQMRAQGKLPVDLYPDSTDSEFDPAKGKSIQSQVICFLLVVLKSLYQIPVVDNYHHGRTKNRKMESLKISLISVLTSVITIFKIGCLQNQLQMLPLLYRNCYKRPEIGAMLATTLIQPIQHQSTTLPFSESIIT